MIRGSYLFLILFTLAGCSAGSGEGLNSNGRPFQPGDDAPLSASFKSIQDNVFTPVCTVCHAGASAPVGLQLDNTNSYNMLVGVDSVQAPGTLRVNPGNPDASYLIAKLEGTAAVGGQMPLGGPVLPQATIDMIRQWISDGAQAATTNPPPANQPPTVTSTTPADGQSLTSLPAAINVAFSHAIDATTVSLNTVTLQRSGGDGNFTDGNEVTIAPVSVSLSTANTSLVTMDLSGITNADDTYRITVIGNGPATIQDLNGNALDGNNDGTAGGDFTAVFTVASSSQTLEATWRSIQDNVFTPICIVCHSGGGAPEGLQLDAANSYSRLVNVSSAQQPSFMRVAPGDPDNSYLIQKLEGSSGSGSQMPQGGPPLPQSTIDVIRQWISNGAANESNSPPPDSVFALTLTAPGSAISGDEFPLSVSIENTGSDTASGATVTLSWLPPDSMILRDGEASQPLATLNAGAATSVNWVMRADVAGEATVTVTVTESNSAFTQVSTNIMITE